MWKCICTRLIYVFTIDEKAKRCVSSLDFFYSLFRFSFAFSCFCNLYADVAEFIVVNWAAAQPSSVRFKNIKHSMWASLHVKSPKVERNSLKLVLCRPPHLFASALHDCRGSNLKQWKILISPIAVNWPKNREECWEQKEKERVRNIDCVCDALMLLVCILGAMRCASIKWA